MSNITADMKTRCVGRYLIDMPAGVTALGTAKVDDVLVQSEPMTYERFEELSEERDEKMRSTKSSLGYRYLYASGKVPTVAQTQYFISLGDYASSSDATRIIDAYKWDGGYQLTLKLEATDFTQSKYRDRAFMQEVPIKNNLPEKTNPHCIRFNFKIRGPCGRRDPDRTWGMFLWWVFERKDTRRGEREFFLCTYR